MKNSKILKIIYRLPPFFCHASHNRGFFTFSTPTEKKIRIWLVNKEMKFIFSTILTLPVKIHQNDDFFKWHYKINTKGRYILCYKLVKPCAWSIHGSYKHTQLSKKQPGLLCSLYTGYTEVLPCTLLIYMYCGCNHNRPSI